jgi:hypothetical protein
MVQKLGADNRIIRKCRKQVCSEGVFDNECKVRAVFSSPFDAFLAEVDSAIRLDASVAEQEGQLTGPAPDIED